VVLRTGFVYFFHHIELSRSTSIEVTGDYQEEGPALLFLHGNGLDGGPRDLDMSGGGATFRYIGSCGGSSCPPDLRPPALAILATDRSRLEIAGDFQLVVDVLAPGAEVHLSSTSGILGRILGGKVSMRSSWVRFHHDQAQAKRDLEEYFRPRVRSVRLLQ
jgi:hypothetical protein